jgi:hypothetical protein
MSSSKLIDLDVVRTATLETEPYPYLMAQGFLREGAVPEIQRSFPDLRITGFQPARDLALHGAFARLIEELGGDDLSVALGRKFGLPLADYPRLITIRKLSAAHEGRIHCDSDKKIANLLIYMNDGWSSPDGRLRVLRSKDSFDDYAAEVDPLTGTVFSFRRSDNSWHGHTAFVGERRVIQVAWIRSEADANRKIHNHRITSFLRQVLGR